MTQPRTDMVGRRFGDLVVMHEAPKQRGSRQWICQCDCGSESTKNQQKLLSGNTTSCGAHRSASTMAKMRAYQATPAAALPGKRNRRFPVDTDSRSRLCYLFNNMHQRCKNQNHDKYIYYGGRGIRVCDEWREYGTFREWAIGSGYADTLSIDRIDVDGPYSPQNCRWIPQEKQASNKRNNVRLTAFGETKIVAEWVRDPRCTVDRSTLHERLQRGWIVTDAIAAPSKRPDLSCPKRMLTAKHTL